MSTSLVIGLDKEVTSTMGAKFYAKGPGNEGYVKNLDVMAFDDLDGGTFFQMALHKATKGQYYVYGTMRDSIGIIDVTMEVFKWLF
jgi:hypothetical protein